MNNFYKKISKNCDNDCWIWNASKDKKGYGNFYFNGKKTLAHRASFEIHNDKIPVGFLVCHKCDNPSCVNPDHLFLGTYKDNTDDMMKKKRGNMHNEENHFGAKIKKEQIKIIFNMSSNFSQREIAQKFNVSQCVIQNILHHKTWLNAGLRMVNLTPKGRRPLQYGSKNPKAKISEEHAIYILKIRGSKSSRQLAMEFDVSEGTIRNIWARKTWTHIKVPENE